jgi:hypothetical protein
MRFMAASRHPSVMKPPGARIISSTGWNLGPMLQPICFQRVRVPLPATSRIDATITRAMVNPRPMPMPSARDSQGELRAANASARPRMMQLTTIRGMKMPRLLCRSCA